MLGGIRLDCMPSFFVNICAAALLIVAVKAIILLNKRRRQV